MKRYYVNKDAKIQDGQHEVHHEDCENLSNEAYNIYLGEFNTCIGAVAKAKRIFPGSNGCAGPVAIFAIPGSQKLNFLI